MQQVYQLERRRHHLALTVFAGEEKLTTALLDRLALTHTVLTTKGKSHRMRKRRGREDRRERDDYRFRIIKTLTNHRDR